MNATRLRILIGIFTAMALTTILTGCNNASAFGSKNSLHRLTALLDSLRKDVNGRYMLYNYYIEPDDTMQFALYTPRPIEAGRIYPLVLFLPDESVMNRGVAVVVRSCMGALAWGSDEFQKRTPCYILVPECKASPGNVTQATERTMRLLRKVLDNWQLDNSRIYVAGQSLGALMAMQLTADNPELFAAAFYVECDDVSPELTKGITALPYIYISAKTNTNRELAHALSSRNKVCVNKQLSATLGKSACDSIASQMLHTDSKHFIVTLNDINPNDRDAVYDMAFSSIPMLDWMMQQHTLNF